MMKNIILVILIGLLVGVSGTLFAKPELDELQAQRGTAVIEDIDYETKSMVIDDELFYSLDDVKIHTQFIEDNVFSRLRVGMKIKYTYEYVRMSRYKQLSEIWVEKNN